MTHILQHNFRGEEPHIKPYPGWVLVLVWGAVFLAWPIIILALNVFGVF